MSTEWNRLHDLFRDESKSLQRWFFRLVILIGFIVLVLWPYIRTVQSLDLIEQGIESITDRIQKARVLADTYTHGIERASLLIGDASSFQAHYSNTESWVRSLDEINFLYDQKNRQLNSLRSALSPEENAQWTEGKVPGSDIRRTLIRERPEQARQLQSASSCFWKQENHWIRCKIAAARSEIDQQWLEYRQWDAKDINSKLTKKSNIELSVIIELNNRIYEWDAHFNRSSLSCTSNSKWC